MCKYLVIFALILSGAGCTTASVLVSRDDQTFREATHNFERTLAIVDRMHVAPAERALFLEAESFYDYRFEAPPRDFRLLISEAVAVMTDFPAFQTLSGNFDLINLRLRATDASAQLWEMLLLQNPRTPLRQLTLYRLGWAYRYTGVEGLPRNSPHEPFDILIAESPNSDLAQLARMAKETPWKSKDKAASWSVVPGLGQFYLGKTQSGLIRLGVGLAAATAFVIPLVNTLSNTRGFDLRRDWGQVLLGMGGLIVLSFDYTSSYEDAMRGVVKYNESHEAEFKSAHPTAP